MTDIPYTEDAPFMPLYGLMPRFWSKIDTSSSNSGCWLWTSVHTGAGYGVLYIKTPYGRKQLAAHRIGLAIKLGRFPYPSELACHRCNAKNCVNPLHLYAGTQKQNVEDSIREGTWSSRWVKGHGYAPRSFSDDVAKKILDLYFGDDGNAYHFDRYRRNVKWTTKTLGQHFGASQYIVQRIIAKPDTKTKILSRQKAEKIVNLFFGSDGQGYGKKVRMSRGRWTCRTIGEHLGVHHKNVYALVSGRTYRHLERPFYDENWERLGRAGRSSRFLEDKSTNTERKDRDDAKLRKCPKDTA